MHDSDKSKFATLIYGMGEYYGKEVTQGVAKIYWESLKVHDYDTVSNAATRHMEDPDGGQFMPKVADFKRIIESSKQTQAMTAWAKVDKAIRRVGPWESVSFDDPIINRVLSDLGGWISLCETKTEKDLEFRMHEFKKLYQAYSLHGLDDYPKQLTGMRQAHNARLGAWEHDDNGLPINFKAGPDTADNTILIGNKKNALEVMRGGSDKPQLEITKPKSAKEITKLITHKG